MYAGTGDALSTYSGRLKDCMSDPAHATVAVKATGTVRHGRNAHAKTGSQHAVPARPSLRRLARRSGVKRMTESTHPTVRAALNEFLERVIGDAVTLTEYARRSTVTTADVVYALRLQNAPLYGAGVVESRPRRARASRPTPDEEAAVHAFAAAATERVIMEQQQAITAQSGTSAAADGDSEYEDADDVHAA